MAEAVNNENVALEEDLSEQMIIRRAKTPLKLQSMM